MWVNLFYLILSISVIYLFKNTFIKIMKYTRFQYKFWIGYILTILLSVISMPVLIFHWKDAGNGQFAVPVIKLISRIIGLKWQIRNGGVLRVDRGAVVVINHQSALDIFGLSLVYQEAKKCVIIIKKEVLYLFTIGIGMYLCGSIFIDRNHPKKAYEQIEMKAKKAFKNKEKMIIFPEGTRNRDLTKLLNFKKGAFATAITFQVPIIPVVFSPFYFVNYEKQIFDRGQVIIQCLEAVPTTGLTMDDLPDLMDRIYNIMNRTYNELLLEAKSTYLVAELPDSVTGLRA